jgi:REP element-mobilizing transposase RayT
LSRGVTNCLDLLLRRAVKVPHRHLAAATHFRRVATLGWVNLPRLSQILAGALFAKAGRMTLPRPILPGRVYMVTRRCAQRAFLLRPDDITNQIFLYALGVAAQRFNIRIIAVTTMSNHYHAVVHDLDGTLPRFLELFHVLTARPLNRHRNRQENFWAAEQANFNYCVEQRDVLEKTVYALANPVAAQLVDKVMNWPGVSSLAWLDGRTIVVKRPRLFFSRSGSLPDSVSLQLSGPPRYEGDRASWAAQVQQRVVDSEMSAAAVRRCANGRVIGRKTVLAASPFDRPTAAEPRSGLRPLIASKDSWARIQALSAIKEFRLLYQRARLAFRAGFRDVLFPAGTFALFHSCGVKVSPAQLS